ncbi:MAG: helix-turn-helix transcriptional regulator [Lachnospiraceae bacterium]|nr:helix-turn-helix transcriptional regulator [Lachnospiraceae bacterium]
MALEIDIIRARLKEAFGRDSQETVGKKLNMTQGNVSKLLSGTQQPTLETIYHVSEIYGVSVDWLLGLSDKKEIHKLCEGTTYATAVRNLHELIRHGALKVEYNANALLFRVADPLIKMLTEKSVTIYKTDKELYDNWNDTKLALFQYHPLIWEGTWSMNGLDFLTVEATTEADWLEVWDEAKKVEDDCADLMSDNTEPFGEGDKR